MFDDPAFIEMLGNVVGLYVDSSAYAVVLSVDKKSLIRALDRTQPIYRRFCLSKLWVPIVGINLLRIAKEESRIPLGIRLELFWEVLLGKRNSNDPNGKLFGSVSLYLHAF